METIKRVQQCNRRHFLGGAGLGLGALRAAESGGKRAGVRRESDRSKRCQQSGDQWYADHASRECVIYLFQSGAPSQIEMFDHKPVLQRLAGQELPASVRMGQRLTTMTSGQSSFPLVPSKFSFSPCGSSGAEVSELIPHTGGIVDDLCIVKSMVTEAINHDPAITFCQTGSQLAGRPSIGAWVAYGLGGAESRFAELRRDAVASGRASQRPTPVRSSLGERVSAHESSRS